MSPQYCKLRQSGSKRKLPRTKVFKMVFHITPVPLWSFLNHESQKESYLDVTEMYILLFFIVNIYCKYFKINNRITEIVFFFILFYFRLGNLTCVYIYSISTFLLGVSRDYFRVCVKPYLNK